MHEWLRYNPQVKTIRVAAADLNGQPRGKRIPTRFAERMPKDGTRFPFSVLNLDIWGEDIEDSPLIYETGDADGVLRPTERGFMPMPWLENPSALLPIWMFHEDGTPFAGDPRHALARVVKEYHDQGLYPVCATELEFYLIDDSGKELRQPTSPRSGKRRPGADTLALRALDAFDGFFTDLYEACEAMDIDADTAISEAGIGQFEINLLHSKDVLKVADDTWLFKMLVKGLARRHGFAASFMAKPYPNWPGNGMHMHFSIVNDDGKNLFDNGTHEGNELLRQAVAGCLDYLADSTLLMAPHANSYERMVPDAHAPNAVCWGYDNRTAALRIPSGSPKARRIEHRVAGGDINPYLMIAGVLGAALAGIEDEMIPPAPIAGNAYDLELPQMPATWQDAIEAFAGSQRMARIFPPLLIDNLVRTKRQELRYMAELSDSEITDLYLDTV